MDALHLDYQRNFRPWPVAGVALLTAALAVAALLVDRYREDGAALSALEDRQAQLERQLRRHDGRVDDGGHDQERLARQVARANDVLRRISLPWDELFRAVESSMRKDVALLAVEPDADRRVLRLTAEARDAAELLAYVRALEGQALFSSVFLQSHEVQEQDPQRPLRFVVGSTWRDAR